MPDTTPPLRHSASPTPNPWNEPRGPAHDLPPRPASQRFCTQCAQRRNCARLINREGYPCLEHLPEDLEHIPLLYKI